MEQQELQKIKTKEIDTTKKEPLINEICKLIQKIRISYNILKGAKQITKSVK